MALGWAIDSNGGFIAYDLTKRWAMYAQPSSSIASAAKKGKAEQMAKAAAKDMATDLNYAARVPAVRESMDHILAKVVTAKKNPRYVAYDKEGYVKGKPTKSKLLAKVKGVLSGGGSGVYKKNSRRRKKR